MFLVPCGGGGDALGAGLLQHRGQSLQDLHPPLARLGALAGRCGGGRCAIDRCRACFDAGGGSRGVGFGGVDHGELAVF